MANSNFRDICNRIARQVGLAEVSTDEKFNAKVGLERPYLQIIEYVDDADAKLVLRLTELFSQRRFITSTQTNVAHVDLNDLCDLEGVKYHSMRCNTSGAARPLPFMDYNLYRQSYPDLTQVPKGKPQFWTFYENPEEMGVTDRQRRIYIVPTPDASYEIEYQAKVLHQPLRTGEQLILWPPPYEHVLIAFGRDMIERKLGTDDLSAYAQAALENVRMWASGPVDQPIKINMGGLSFGRECQWGRNRRWYYPGGY